MKSAQDTMPAPLIGMSAILGAGAAFVCCEQHADTMAGRMAKLAISLEIVGFDEQLKIEWQPRRFIEFQQRAPGGNILNFAGKGRAAGDLHDGVQACAAPAKLSPID